MNILDKIFARKREVADEKFSASELDDLRSRVADAPSTLGFKQALRASRRSVALIAEIKKASPVRGVIRENFDAIEIAAAYARAGADCLSVLTDEEFFQGHPDYLLHAKSEALLPVLRKDFTVHEGDIYESRIMGADAILLIVNGLTASQLVEYRELAESLGMDAIIEVHSPEEASIAVETGAKIIGVNNRDLETFGTNLAISEELLPSLRGKATLVSESAMSAKSDVDRVCQSGADAVLIGTAFCAQPDVEAAVNEIMGWR